MSRFLTIIRLDSVSLLTRFHRWRRFYDVAALCPVPCRRLFGLSTLLILVGPNIAWSQAVAVAWQSTDEITRVAEDFLRDRVGHSDQRVTPQAGKLDNRLQLPRCSEELEPFLRRGAEIGNRTIVGVRCNGMRPWKMYVPVDVIVTESIMVTRRTLPKGHVLGTNDFIAEDRDIARLRGGYVTNPQDLLGQRLKQPLQGGRIITPSVLQADILVRRGQTVTLIVANDALNIRMAGKALMDGRQNQRIRVENTTSQRVVEGLVRSRELVEILIN